MTGFEELEAAVHDAARGAEVLHALDPMRHIPFESGGPALHSVAVYRCEEEPAHWHFVTFGLSPMSEERTGAEDYELTMRVTASRDPDDPPRWPVLLLRGLARYVRTTRHSIAPGDTFGNGAPLTLATGESPYDDPGTASELLFGVDPGLRATTEHAVRFIQAFGVTLDEFRAAQHWSGSRLWELLSESSPLMVTDPWRSSALEDDEIAREVEEGIDRDGSSQVSTMVPGLSWEPHPDDDFVTVNLPVRFVEELTRMFRGRTRHGEPFVATSEREVPVETIEFLPGDGDGDDGGWHVDEQRGHLVVELERPVVGPMIDELSEASGGYVEVDGSNVRFWMSSEDD